MKLLIFMSIIVFLFSTSIPVNGGQVSLAEIKKKEEERRKKTETSKESLDNSTILNAGKTRKNSSGFMQDNSKTETNILRNKRDMQLKRIEEEKKKISEKEFIIARNVIYQNWIRNLERNILIDTEQLNRLYSTDLDHSSPKTCKYVLTSIQEIENRLKANQEALKKVREQYEEFKREAISKGISLDLQE